MTLRFLTDYRSRTWMKRFTEGEVAEVNSALAQECLDAGVAVAEEGGVEPTPAPAVAPVAEPVPAPAPDPTPVEGE